MYRTKGGENMASEIMQGFVDLVKKSGKRVEKDTPYCVNFVATHENCIGCESKEGCDAVCKIAMIMMYPILYKAKDFEEFLRQEKYIREKIKQVLDGEDVDI